MWFLARQWQRGEFEAESGGTPMLTILRARLYALDRIRLSEGNTKALDPRVPLEAVVEPELAATSSARPEAWRPEQLSYGFTLRSNQLQLDAADYDGLWLDWHDFDLTQPSDTGDVAQEIFMTPGQLQIPGAAGDLFLAPNVAVSIGRNYLVEEVRYLRDEAENLVWARERQLTDAGGALLQTFASDARAVNDGQVGGARRRVSDDPKGDLPEFRLMSDIDPAWIPYLPQQIADVPALDGQIALRRARSHESYTKDEPQYRGQIVAETPALAEEEVPPGEITIKREHRYALDSEGRVHFWIGRSKDVATPAPRPKLRFDFLTKPGEGGKTS